MKGGEKLTELSKRKRPVKKPKSSKVKKPKKVAAPARDYRSEYDNYHKKPKQIARRAARNSSRRLMVKAGAVHKGDGKDVDHKDRNPKNSSRKNLRVTSKSKNRSRNQ